MSHPHVMFSDWCQADVKLICSGWGPSDIIVALIYSQQHISKKNPLHQSQSHDIQQEINEMKTPAVPALKLTS